MFTPHRLAFAQFRSVGFKTFIVSGDGVESIHVFAERWRSTHNE